MRGDARKPAAGIATSAAPSGGISTDLDSPPGQPQHDRDGFLFLRFGVEMAAQGGQCPSGVAGPEPVPLLAAAFEELGREPRASRISGSDAVDQEQRQRVAPV